ARRPRPFIIVLLATLGVFCLLDQTTWQPWIFQYASLLATAALFRWDDKDGAGARCALNLARLIIIATYIFSGLQKINWNFVSSDWPWIVEPITKPAPWAATPLYYFGFAVPLLQVAFGVGLLTRRFRRASLVMAVTMHVFILAMFG